MHSIACRKRRKKRHSIIDRDKSREIDTRNEQKRPRKRCNRMQFLPNDRLEAKLLFRTTESLGLHCSLVFTYSLNGTEREREENRSMHRNAPDVAIKG